MFKLKSPPIWRFYTKKCPLSILPHRKRRVGSKDKAIQGLLNQLADILF